jgi:spermidine/putrescine transport system substrate-binding protein
MSDRRMPLRGNLTRRRFLQGSAMAGVAAFLAACTGTKTGTSAAPSTAAASASAAASVEASPSVAATPKVATGPLKFANWPAYIDLAGAAAEAEEYQPGSSPALEAFKKKYSIDVDYQEKIDGNDSFVQTIKPALVGGLPTGWDLMVLTDWMASKIVANNWAEKIDQTNVPTAKKNLREALRNQPWDPGNDFHYPWQSGMTGVGFNAKTLKANGIALPTKIADLWAIP